MMLKLLMPLSLALLSTMIACDSKKKNETETPIRTVISLNAPTEIIGTWRQCIPSAGDKSKAGFYTFQTDGILSFQSVAYASKDCSGEATKLFAYQGTYLASAGNSLDMSLEVGRTLFRVYAIQGKQLSISNNLGAGAGVDSRDVDLDTSALILTKVSE